jgi:hypothetical protein
MSVTPEVTAENLGRGISAFRPGWRTDFHASLYTRHETLLAAGVTDHWWATAVDDLSRWIALRPLSKVVVYRTGRKVLPRLQAALDSLPPRGADFGEVAWNDVALLFEAASSVKPGPSAVFPSKLCHFMRPDLFVVVDRALMGMAGGRYPSTWKACSSAWKRAHPIHGTLRQVLRDASKAVLSPTYPYATKITELCIIGANPKAPLYPA